ncbi:UbiA prenyltransferase family-domain-containing protein [Mycena olivaceomarginata]|nr:UbiA prenyltransferase family-domain-containing protein [Mycena olivaceomarginata]
MAGQTPTETTPLNKTAKKDAPPLKPILAAVPEGLRPYLELIRLEKPTGTILMFWPFVWGLTMAAYTNGLPLNAYWIGIGKALVGAFLLRSSACTINDFFDRKVDAGVERSKGRPLASGRISVPAALLYLFAQYAVGVAFFYYTEHGLALQVALIQLIPLFGIYPLMKRITYWPQAWLGFAMNFGFITAWVSVTGSLNYPILGVAMASQWCWTMLYDTIYACQDIRDDVKMGVRSTAILFGTWIRPLLISFGIGFVTLIGVAGYLNHQSTPFYVVSIGGTFLHLLWQYRTVDLDVPKSCWDNFNSNGRLGWILWAGLFIDYVLAHDLVALPNLPKL